MEPVVFDSAKALSYVSPARLIERAAAIQFQHLPKIQGRILSAANDARREVSSARACSKIVSIE
ncbi:MAG: hypothetical protein ACRD6X_06575 [Pyrinomonadaceae bacterium]